MRISYTDEYGKHDIGLPDGLSDSDLQGAIAAYRQTYARPSIPQPSRVPEESSIRGRR